MDLTLGPEQESVRDAIRGMLADRLPLPRIRARPEVDDEVWREAGELGWFTLGLPESAGGAGYGLPEEMILFVELGRALAPGPWLGTLLAAHVLGSAERARRVAVVDDPTDALCRDARLVGTADAVTDAAGVDAFLVVGGTRVRWVAGDARGLAVAVRPSIDPTRPLARVRFDGVAAEDLRVDAGALRARATVLVAAEAVGVAERTLEASVAYAKVRQQFGRPIGSFQAVKHRCADMAVRAEVARSITTWAAVAVRDGEPDAARTVREAKALAGDAALANASDNVQNHGGMGFTWEADAHLYLKRAWLLEHQFGSRAAQLDALTAAWTS